MAGAVYFKCFEYKRIELYDITGRKVYMNEGILQQEKIKCG